MAHELRPLPVLQMTMDYLIARIVDRCDKLGENLAEWFNFLWDRMRGIRKVNLYSPKKYFYFNVIFFTGYNSAKLV